MSRDSTTSAEVVRFCLGSASYRQTSQTAFLDALTRLPADTLVALLGKAHLSGLFASLVDSLPHPAVQTALRKLAPVLQARNIFNNNILAELLHFGAQIAAVDPSLQPVVLKGMSYWQVYYPEPMARRVRDLDLLVDQPEHADLVCQILQQEGYDSLLFVDDERSISEHFRDGDSYSVPPLRIRRRADLEDLNFPELTAVIQRYGSDTGLELLDDEGPVLTVDVELHKALFTATEGQSIAPQASYFQASQHLPNYRELTTATALAYTGVKLALDILETLSAGDNNLKCLKLAADLVRILEHCSQADFATAIDMVKRWQCLHHFIDSLQAVRQLAPEIQLHGLPPSDGQESLDLLLHTGLTSFEDTLACSA